MKLNSCKHTFPAGLFTVMLSLILLISSCNTKPKPAGEADNTAPTGKATYSDSASSTVRVFDQNGKVCIQKSNTYYEIVNAYDEANKVPLLLKIRKTELCVADSVNNHKVYEISAKSVMDNKDISWNTQLVATDLQFGENTMLAIMDGSDNEEDYMTRYNLLDGKEVFSDSYGELKVSISNSKDKRFIGFVSRKAASSPLKQLNEENVLGEIRYSSGTKAISTLRLILKRSAVASKIPSSTPDMTLVPVSDNTTAIEDGKTIIIKPGEGQQVSVTGFALKMTFYYGDDNEATEITIPVAGDALDPLHAMYDKEIFDLVAN